MSIIEDFLNFEEEIKSLKNKYLHEQSLNLRKMAELKEHVERNTTIIFNLQRRYEELTKIKNYIDKETQVIKNYVDKETQVNEDDIKNSLAEFFLKLNRKLLFNIDVFNEHMPIEIPTIREDLCAVNYEGISKIFDTVGCPSALPHKPFDEL